MPIGDRQPETIVQLTAHPAASERRGGIDSGIDRDAPGVRRSSGAPNLDASLPAPARALALDALRVNRLLHDAERRPDRWGRPAFAAEVEQVRRHLAPIRSRRTLAASYAREAFHLALRRTDQDDPCPIRLAYALRWLELRDGATGPSWQSLLA